MEIVALGFQKLQDVQRFQRGDAGDIDLLQLVADFVPDFYFHVLGEKAETHGRHFFEAASDALLN